VEREGFCRADSMDEDCEMASNRMRRPDAGGTRMSRRRALALLTAGPVAAMSWTSAEAEQAHQHATEARAQAQAAAAYKRKFFRSSRATNVPAAQPTPACRSSSTS
jgi:hypothetical protein